MLFRKLAENPISLDWCGLQIGSRLTKGEAMLQVFGYVFARETGAGIPNLVVVAFDCGRAHESLRSQSPTAEILQNLGTRIGSVLTASDGRFVLTADDLAFQGNESRPDLVIVVFAPEDVNDPERPYPEPPDRRVLYVSLLPRVDAGAREAFVIRLARAVVGKYLNNAGIEPVINGFEQAWKARDTIADGLKARHIQELERRSSAREDAAMRVKKLTAVPLTLRNNKFLVTNRAALSETVERGASKATKQEVLQAESMHTGLQKLKRAGKANIRRLYVSKSDLEALEVSLKDGQLSGGHTTLAKLDALTLRLNGGNDLIRKKSGAVLPLEQLEQKYLKATAPNGQQEKPAQLTATDTTKRQTENNANTGDSE